MAEVHRLAWFVSTRESDGSGSDYIVSAHSERAAKLAIRKRDARQIEGVYPLRYPFAWKISDVPQRGSR